MMTGILGVTMATPIHLQARIEELEEELEAERQARSKVRVDYFIVL